MSNGTYFNVLNLGTKIQQKRTNHFQRIPYHLHFIHELYLQVTYHFSQGIKLHKN